MIEVIILFLLGIFASFLPFIFDDAKIKINKETKNTEIKCRCGEKMISEELDYIIDFKCPKVKIYNFWEHSTNVGFLKK